MATEKQIEANRENALSSTGPRTPEGKARAAVNRTTHALTGRHTVLHTESAEGFEQLLAGLREEWNPQAETETQQVELIAHHWWRLLRIARIENDSFTRTMETRRQLALNDDIDRLSRYEARIRRAYHQAIDLLRKLQSARAKPGVKTNPISAGEPAPGPTPPPLTAPPDTAPDVEPPADDASHAAGPALSSDSACSPNSRATGGAEQRSGSGLARVDLPAGELGIQPPFPTDRLAAQ